MVGSAHRSSPRSFDAVVFDVDGVLVASPHERAWQEALAGLMAGPWRGVASSYAPERFTTAVYQEHVAGKARFAGARAALDHFGIAEDAGRTAEYAARKQRRIDELIAAGEFVAFDDGLRLVVTAKADGLRLAAASSSRNAGRFMERIRIDGLARRCGVSERVVPAGATLRDVFEVDVCGRDLPHGKPHPDIFLLAAAELGIAPAKCVVVEDAPSGVLAAKAAGMAAIGVARLGDRDLLDAAGANLVVTSLDDVDVAALLDGRLATDGQARRQGGEP